MYRQASNFNHVTTTIQALVVCTILAISTVCLAQGTVIPTEKFSDPPRPSVLALEKLETLKKTVATNPESFQAWTALGWRLYKNGQYGEAEWVMGEARKLSSKDLYVLWLSGLCSYAVGDYEKARTFLMEVWEKNKTWPPTIDMGITYNLLGRIAFDRDDLFQTAFFLGKAAEESPNNWQVHFILGVAEWYRERYAEALEALNRARTLNPKDPRILQSYAWARMAVNERHLYWTREAVEQDLYPEAPADAQKALTDFKADLNVVNEAINADPGDFESYQLLGHFYTVLKNKDKAAAAYRQAISLNDNSALPRYFLAETLLSEDTPQNTEEIEQLLIESISRKPALKRGSVNAPHVGLLIHLLIQQDRLIEAQAVTDWFNEQEIEDQE